ncbi:hypothetical protein [Duganella callida]|uniref:Cell envelope biogenesis protein TolA n=1 Tax=Duganella callida TaxID=2561932 RepID=A0A4Y9SCD1_9BURK|nr:hypothetical protein [Duganella callida]TFW20034.1 hypothetical protein E4L98_15470 [Duganella callida]
MKAIFKQLGALIVAAVAVSAPARAQVKSVAEADAALEQVRAERAAVHETFAASERECSTKFFVNNCLDKAKEKRRVDLAALRVKEVDAEHFKRVDSVARRDADLVERNRKDAEDQAARAAQPPKPPHEEKAAPAAPTGVRVAEREAQHDAKVKAQEQQDAAEAGKRAANVAAFERKQAESQRRQAEVARKKAENEAKAKRNAERAEEDRRKAEAAAAAAAAKKQ